MFHFAFKILISLRVPKLSETVFHTMGPVKRKAFCPKLVLQNGCFNFKVVLILD